ncbi:peroxidasin homolog [Mytilus galloprovincialis]|uniref:peroxidasin homolog n=1 Tax=Mytilus galloprovincialis TaxID=29158 RepID=UPI003F7BFD30
MSLILVLVLETLKLVDSYYMCLCLCLDADFPDKWNDLPFKNGVCENRHMEGFCPYTCNVGYTGDCCQTSVDTNACSDPRNHCQNGGTCISASTCLCSDDYTGRYCETNINECASNPCRHGGVCHDGVNKFTCTCTVGYNGNTCETVDECVSNPCQNKGVCIDRMNGYTCNCPNGYGGIHCQYDISECHSSPCVNGGVCNDMVNGYNCSCPRGYTGRHCQTVPTIKIAPTIYLNEQKTIDEGTDVFYIPCFAEGIPLPSITWESIDKQTLPSNSRQLADFLLFENVTTDDNGLYMCTAKNELGTEIKVVHVIVKAKPKQLHTVPLIYALTMVQVNYYGDARLVCNVTGYPAPSITWKYKNKMLQSSRNILSVHNVTNTTSGYYTCIATNDAGTSQANILLKVIYDLPKIVTPPKTAVIMTGHSHNFTCIATGHPSPSIKWSFKSFTQQSTTLPSHQLHQQGSLLTLFAIKTHESGTLTCTAENEFGNDTASISVIFRNPSTSGLG